MQINDKGEVIWEPVNPEIVAIYQGAIAYHLYKNLDRVLTEETDDASAQAR